MSLTSTTVQVLEAIRSNSASHYRWPGFVRPVGAFIADDETAEWCSRRACVKLWEPCKLCVQRHIKERIFHALFQQGEKSSCVSRSPTRRVDAYFTFGVTSSIKLISASHGSTLSICSKNSRLRFFLTLKPTSRLTCFIRQLCCMVLCKVHRLGTFQSFLYSNLTFSHFN